MINNTIRIIDLGEATIVYTLGFDLLNIEKAKMGDYKVFVFGDAHPSDPGMTAEQCLKDYKRRHLKVEPLGFYQAGRELKKKIYEHTALEEQK